MAEDKRLAAFLERYRNGAVVWQGGSFTGYLNLRALLEELPVSEALEPSREYPFRYEGISDNVYGEIIHHLLAYEGYLKDKAFHLKECAIKPIIRNHTYLYQFSLRYTTREGEERVRTYEVGRTRERNFVFFYDPLRT